MKRIALTAFQIAITIAIDWWVFHDPVKRAEIARERAMRDFRVGKCADCRRIRRSVELHRTECRMRVHLDKPGQQVPVASVDACCARGNGRC